MIKKKSLIVEGSYDSRVLLVPLPIALYPGEELLNPMGFPPHDCFRFRRTSYYSDKVCKETLLRCPVSLICLMVLSSISPNWQNRSSSSLN